MLRIAVVLLALVGCSKSKSVDDPLGECTQTRDPKVCIDAAKAELGKHDNSGAEYLYGVACEVHAADGCLGAAETYLSDSSPDMDRVREYLGKGCSLKNDTACKKLAALPADAPPPKPVVPADASGPAIGSATAAVVADAEEQMTDLAFCNFLVKRMCTQCAASRSWTQDQCVTHQTAAACAKMTGSTRLHTPSTFRMACAVAIGKMDCATQAGHIPPECHPQ